MPRRKIVDETEDVEVLDLRDIKPDNLVEITNVIDKVEAIELDREVETAGYDIEILGDDE